MAVGDMDDCPRHPKQKVVLFCQTCDELICTKCISKTPNSSAIHQDHVYLDLMDAFDMQKEDMQKIMVQLRESVNTKRQQRQETLSRIQKLKFALLRKKGFVSKESRSLQALIKTEEHHFKQRLWNVISTALECEERAHKELDYETVSREGLVGTVDSISKISPFRCTLYLRNISRVKKEILSALEQDKESSVLGSGNLWSAQIGRLRDVTLHVHGEKSSIRRAFRFPTEAPSPPRLLLSWCVVGSDSANIVWKYRRQEKVDYFRVTCTPVHAHRWRHLRPQWKINVRPVVAKRNHVVLRHLEPNCEYALKIQAINKVAESAPANIHLYTHMPSESVRQGRVWSESHGRCHGQPPVNQVVRSVVCLVMTSLVVFALLWVVFATFEREFCGVLRDTPLAKTQTEHLEHMCPMPEEMKAAMEARYEGGWEEVEGGGQEGPMDSWLNWFKGR